MWAPTDRARCRADWFNNVMAAAAVQRISCRPTNSEDRRWPRRRNPGASAKTIELLETALKITAETGDETAAFLSSTRLINCVLMLGRMRSTSAGCTLNTDQLAAEVKLLSRLPHF